MFRGSNPPTLYFFVVLCRAKKRKKYTSIFRRFCYLKTKKTGFRTADQPSESPILPIFARFLPKMQEKTPFVVVDKRGFFYGRNDRVRPPAGGAVARSDSPPGCHSTRALRTLFFCFIHTIWTPARGVLIVLVRATGIEPACPCEHKNLNLARLPVPPRPLIRSL